MNHSICTKKGPLLFFFLFVLHCTHFGAYQWTITIVHRRLPFNFKKFLKKIQSFYEMLTSMSFFEIKESYIVTLSNNLSLRRFSYVGLKLEKFGACLISLADRKLDPNSLNLCRKFVLHSALEYLISKLVSYFSLGVSKYHTSNKIRRGRLGYHDKFLLLCVTSYVPL